MSCPKFLLCTAGTEAPGACSQVAAGVVVHLTARRVRWNASSRHIRRKREAISDVLPRSRLDAAKRTLDMSCEFGPRGPTFGVDQRTTANAIGIDEREEMPWAEAGSCRRGFCWFGRAIGRASDRGEEGCRGAALERASGLRAVAIAAAGRSGLRRSDRTIRHARQHAHLSGV